MELNLTFELSGDSNMNKDQFESREFSNLLKSNEKLARVFEIHASYISSYSKNISGKGDVAMVVVATLKPCPILTDIEISCVSTSDGKRVFSLTDKMSIHLSDSIKMFMKKVITNEQILKIKNVRLMEVDPILSEEEKVRDFLRGNEDSSITVDDKREETKDISDDNTRDIYIL